MAQGTANGVGWKLVLKPGNPVCVALRAAEGELSTLLCDEESEQDASGDENMRFIFGGVNDEQVPKFVFGITTQEAAKVVVGLPSASTETEAKSSTAAPGRTFFAVPLDPQPAGEVREIRALNRAGKTVGGFKFGPPDEGPMPLPLG